MTQVQALKFDLNEDVFSFVLYFVTAFTLTVQCYVFFLVQFKSPAPMAEYRHFLNNFTFWDTLFTSKFIRSPTNNLLQLSLAQLFVSQQYLFPS